MSTSLNVSGNNVAHRSTTADDDFLSFGLFTFCDATQPFELLEGIVREKLVDELTLSLEE